MNRPKSQYVPLRGEELFCKWASQAGLAYRKIEETNSKTPDYELCLDLGTVPVEVKEFEPDKDTIKNLDRLYSTGFGELITKRVGKDVGAKMKKAHQQLKARSRGILPTMLVLNDDLMITAAAVPENIKAVFLGPDKVIATITKNEKTTFRERSGSGRNVFTSISAIGVLNERDTMIMIVYHNPCTKIPLPPEWIFNDYTIHLRLSSEPERFAEWVKA